MSLVKGYLTDAVGCVTYPSNVFPLKCNLGTYWDVDASLVNRALAFIVGNRRLDDGSLGGWDMEEDVKNAIVHSSGRMSSNQ